MNVLSTFKAACFATAAASAIFLALFHSPRAAQSAETISPAEVSGDRIDYSKGLLPKAVTASDQGDQIRSLLNIRRRMQFGDYVWNADNVPAGPVWVRVDLAKQIISVFRAGHEIGSAVIIYGTDGYPTPAGSFPILERAVRHRSSSYNAEMPYMLRLTRDGVAIHASNVQQGSATHGCIGVPLAFAQLLFGQAKIGDSVVIVSA